MDSQMTFVEFLVTFEGRITRRVFWRQFVLPLGVIWLVTLYIEAVFQSSGFGLGGVEMRSGASSFFYLLAPWPIVAVSVKRLHDRNKSGTLMWLVLVPVIGWIWYLVEVGFLDGTHGPNFFGADPLERQPPG
jgi:uncharacterized membrane protein YhaH (DUF805 family)